MLTDAKARNAKPAAKAYRLLDHSGLHLWVTPAGGRFWRWRHQVGGKEKLVSLGRYPNVGLAEARQKRDAIRDGVAVEAPSPTLSDMITLWHAAQVPRWRPHHAADVLASLTVEIVPSMGHLRLADVTTPVVLERLKAIQARGAVETAHRIRQRLSDVFGFAAAHGHTIPDPCARLARALMPVVRQGRRAALLDIDAARVMLARAEAIPAQPVTRLALRLLALTALRPGELRHGEWSEIDGDLWRVPAARMKGTTERAASMADHMVPLSSQALEALAALRKFTGRGKLMFPGSSSERPISENAIGYLLNRAGYASRQTAHGFRATFSTIMNEKYPADRAAIDLMLAHTPARSVEAAYNRASHTGRRRELAQAWADLLLAGMPDAGALTVLSRRSPRSG